MTKTTKLSPYATQDAAPFAMPIIAPVIVPHPSLNGTTTTWTITTGGNFNTAANWSNGVPTAGINAVISEASNDPIIVTLSGVNDTADSLSTQFAGLSMTNATLTLQGALGAGDGSSISTGAGTALAQTGGLLDFQNGPSGNDSSSISGGGAGVIQASGIIEVDAGTLTISGNSSFGGTITGLGNKPDSGIVFVTGGATYNFKSTAVISVGTFEVVGGSNMITAGTMTLTGNFIESSGSTLTFGANGFTLNDTAGTISAIGGLLVGTKVLNQRTLAATGATLSSGVTFSNTGTLLFNDGGGTALTMGNGGAAATFLNSSAISTISVLGGNYIIAANNATLTNIGHFLLGVGGSLTDSAVLINSATTGTISVGGNDTFSQANSFTNASTINGAGLFQITGNGIDTLATGSSISVGTFSLNDFNDGATLNINGGTISSAQFGLHQGGTVNLGENLSYAGSFTADANAALMSVNLGTYTLSLSGINLFDPTNFGNVSVSGRGTLALAGTTNLALAGLALGEGTTLANSGILFQAAGLQLGDLNATAAASNSAAGTWQVLGNDTLGSNVISSSNPNSTFANAGTFAMTAVGDVATLDAVFTNTGILTASNGATINVADTLSNTGTIGGAGEVEITAGTSTLGSGTVLSAGTLALLGSSTVKLGTSLSYAGIFTLSSGASIGLNLGSGTLSLTGTTYLGTNTTTVIDGPGTLALASSSTTFIGGSNIVLGYGAMITNTGSVTQDGQLQLGDNSGTPGNATNSAGGTWTLALGNGISRGANFATKFTNAGLFQDTELGSATSVTAVFANTATVSVTGTELDFYSTFTNAGTLSGTGAIGLRGSAVGTLSGGSVLSVSQFNLDDNATLNLGANISYAGIFADQGYNGTTLNLASHILTLSKTAYFGDANTLALVDGPGTLSLTGATTITGANYGLEIGGGMVMLNAGKLTQNGQLQIGDNQGVSTSVTNSAKGTWAIATGNGISTGSNASSSFTNLGLFQNTGSGALQAITAVFNNSGTVSVALGDETDFYGRFSNTGTISGAGGFALNGTAVGTFSAGEVITVAQFDLYNSATLDLATNLTYAGFFNDQGYNGTTINLTGNTLALTGKTNLGSNNTLAYIDGPGTLSVSGATTITGTNYGMELGGTAAMINTGSLLQNGQLQIGDSTGALASVSNTGTWSMATNAGISTGSNANSSFTNNGLLKNTGTGDTQYITAVLNNAATLSIASGDITNISNSLANTGTISGAGALWIAGAATFSAGSVISVGTINLYNSGTLNLATGLTYGGVFSDQGYNGTTLSLGSNSLSLTGLAYFGSANTDALVTGSGTVSLSGTTTVTQANYGLEIGGTEAFVNAGTLTQAGGLQIGDASGNIATVVNSATGTWKLGTSNIISTGNNASSSFSNAGLVTNIGTGNTERITAVFNNTGTLNDTSFGSTIALAGGGSLAGTLSGAGEIDFENGGVYTLATGTALSVASIGVYNNGTDLSLSGAASYAGTLTEGSGATINLATAAAKLTLTGQDTLDGSVTGSGTVLLSTGGVLIADNLTLGGSVLLQDSGGTIAQAQNMTIGNNAASSASLSIGAGSTYEITGNVTIASQGLGAITNAGNFAMLAGTGTSTIDPLFTNTGTVSSSSGTLVFAANVTNNKSFAASNGHALVFDSSVNATGTATGTISLTSGGLATFGGFVGSAETLSFTDGSSSGAILQSPSNFDGTISGFTGSNTLTLDDFQNATGAYSGGVLTLTGQNDSGTATTVELNFAGSYTLGSFTIQNNGTGGTLIVDPKH